MAANKDLKRETHHIQHRYKGREGDSKKKTSVDSRPRRKRAIGNTSS